MSLPLFSRTGFGRLAWLIGLAVMLTMVGCEDDQPTETTMFESAEVDFRQGHYEQALEGYQTFLEQYPRSPLASTAEMRIRSIHREVSSVMERTDSPRPSYHGYSGEQSAAETGPSPPDSPSSDRGDDESAGD